MLPLNTAPHFVFYYQFLNSLDFCCALHPKICFYHFQGLFVIIKEYFSKFHDKFKDKLHFFFKFQEFSRTKVIFQDFSRSVQTLFTVISEDSDQSAPTEAGPRSAIGRAPDS